MAFQAIAEVYDGGGTSLACLEVGWTGRQPGKADQGHMAASLKCKLWRVGCSWGWWFGRPEKRQLRLGYLVVAQS